METNLDLYSISGLKTMEVIDINTGTKLGFVKDLKIDIDKFKVISIIMPSGKASFFGKSEDIEIPWDKIRKVGIDVILVQDIEQYFKDKE